ncbi:MAG TPA: PHB depolymerase family esterase [Pirellulaceae bacterium]|nr:PHB depolymerase family esterase [Pirellulaceae bacterium]
MIPKLLVWMACIQSPLLAIALFYSVAAAHAADEPGQQVPSSAELKLAGDDGGERTVTLRYLLYLPANYSADEKAAFPLLLFLHGSGERGEDLQLVKKHGPPKLVDQEAHQKTWPFITVSPQCPKETRWNPAELAKLVEHVANTHRIDRRRIYVTGLSMGGSGTWSLLAERPGLFAAAMPICGRGDPAAAEKIAKTPVWIFVGRKDKQELVENCGELDQALRAAGGDSKVTYYDDLPHDCWTVTYDNPAVWQWLLAHQLAESKQTSSR